MASENQQPAARKIAFLGPRGTFSEETALVCYQGAGREFIPYASIDAVIRAVEAGEAAEGIVPVENSLEGAVNVTLDTLAHDVNLFIVREMVLPIRHNLLTGAGTAPINTIISHPQALAQCRGYLKQHHPGTQLVAAESTAAACQAISGASGQAAIGSLRAAALYGLAVVAADIQDSTANSTRFISLAVKPAAAKNKPGKTSVVCRINGEKPGSLCDILTEFAGRGVNLTKIESRPARTGLGEYIFFLDLEGGLGDENVCGAVDAVRRKSLWFKNLGSYPVCTIRTC